MSAHTPGPWRVYTDDLIHGADTVRNEHGQFVAATRLRYVGPHKSPNSTYNADDARLIAAAPDLYDALREVSMLIESGLFKHYEKEPWIDRVRAALAKVEKTL